MTLKELWESAAEICSTVYGTEVDWEEEFFICPYCLEPVYYEDLYEDWNGIFCPICEELLVDVDVD